MSSKSKSATALHEVLASHKAGDLISPDQKVIEITSDTPLEEATQVLFNHNILGAPVWDEKAQKYIGFFDMRDILSAVIASSREMQEKKDQASQKESFGKEFKAVLGKLLSGMKHKDVPADSSEAKTVAALAKKNEFHSCTPSATLADVGRLLSDKRCHRVPVLNESGRCCAIISQSALVKFLSSKLAADKMDETLDEAGMEYQKQILTVNDTAPAHEAFEMLEKHQLSGIAVVDEEDGKLVGNTSARDIKLATLDQGQTAMDMDILSFLAAVQQVYPSKKDRYPFCHVRSTDKVGHVVHLLAKTGYHRVFVIDNDIKPIGVISVADIIRFAMGEK